MSVVAEGSHFIPMGEVDMNKPQFEEKQAPAVDDASRIEEFTEEKPRPVEDLPGVD